jgi:hypothetical protein
MGGCALRSAWCGLVFSGKLTRAPRRGESVLLDFQGGILARGEGSPRWPVRKGQQGLLPVRGWQVWSGVVPGCRAPLPFSEVVRCNSMTAILSTENREESGRDQSQRTWRSSWERGRTAREGAEAAAFCARGGLRARGRRCWWGAVSWRGPTGAGRGGAPRDSRS